MSQRDEAVSRDAAEAVARRSYGKLVALLAARTRYSAAAPTCVGQAQRDA
jgi:RNA polymerase sigma-70 factor (ECF subfamily)